MQLTGEDVEVPVGVFDEEMSVATRGQNVNDCVYCRLSVSCMCTSQWRRRKRAVLSKTVLDTERDKQPCRLQTANSTYSKLNKIPETKMLRNVDYIENTNKSVRFGLCFGCRRNKDEILAEWTVGLWFPSPLTKRDSDQILADI